MCVVHVLSGMSAVAVLYIDCVLSATGFVFLQVNNSFPFPPTTSYIDVLADETDEKAIEFAMSGVCNCCAGKYVETWKI